MAAASIFASPWWRPDWNSIDSVRRAHSNLEITALIFFALLVIAEVVAHLAKTDRIKHAFETAGIVLFAIAVSAEIAAYPYGQRNDTLSEHAIVSLDNRAQSALTASGTALNLSSEAKANSNAASQLANDAGKTASGARLEADTFERDITTARKEAADAKVELAAALRRAAAAEEGNARLTEQLADRVLSESQLKFIARKLAPYKPQEYEITAYWSSPESLSLANQIHSALHAGAGWTFNPEGSKSMMLGGVIGVQVWTHPDADQSTKDAADLLSGVLRSEGLFVTQMTQNPHNPKTNLIAINVGSKR